MDVDVFQIPRKTWSVRYSQEHGWGCITGDGPLWFKKRGIYMPLLPLLEFEHDEVRDMVENGVMQSGLAPAAAKEFPYSELITYALSWETDYWPGDAIKWLERGFPLNQETATALRHLVEDGRRGQRLRHSARALLKRWSREDV
ncbi:MAG TPA: hypothetical protein VJ654_02415 [Noviherbaspirillum sp.]|nr:hypothetical protein [Noviherbaspirillum sp.]